VRRSRPFSLKVCVSTLRALLSANWQSLFVPLRDFVHVTPKLFPSETFFGLQTKARAPTQFLSQR